LALSSAGCFGSRAQATNWEPVRGLDAFVEASVALPINPGTILAAGWVDDVGRGNLLCPTDARFREKFDCTDVILAQGGHADLVSASSNGSLADDRSQIRDATSDGDVILFRSDATNLVSSDFNEMPDLFKWKDGRTLRVNLADNGNEDRGSMGSSGQGPFSCIAWCGFGSLSGNGRMVVFTSWDDTLLENDSNGRPDVFLRDTWENSTMLVSRLGNQSGDDASYIAPFPSASITQDGSIVVFASHATNLGRVIVNSCPGRDSYLHAKTRACPHAYEWIDGDVRPLGLDTIIQDLVRAEYVSITPDGRYAFVYGAFREEDGSDIFRLERGTGVVKRITEDGASRSYPSFSPDGNRLVFSTGLAPTKLFLWDEVDGLRVLFSTNGTIAFPALDPSASRVVAMLDSASLGLKQAEQLWAAELEIER
jgi:hypothetical protein